jgi:hypothetical protein
MLFTSTTAPFRQTPSSIFKEKGDIDGFPGTCVSSRIFAVSELAQGPWSIFKGMIPAIAIANKNRAPSGLTVDAIWKKSWDVSLSSPQIGISFNRVTEAIQAEVEGMGFVPDAHGKFKYFRGTTNAEGVGKLYTLGAKPNAFVPVGIADLEGLEAFIISTRVLAAVRSAIPFDPTTAIFIAEDGAANIRSGTQVGGDVRLPMMEDMFAGTEYRAYDLSDDVRKDYIKKASTLTKKYATFKCGIFLPYFQGLILPDKTQVPEFIISNFSALLGGDGDEIAQSCQTLWSGWSTLATTVPGLQLQHQAYCLNLSINTGTKILSFMPGGQYAGSILLSTVDATKICFFKRGKSYNLVELKELEKELKQYDSQEEALGELCSIISAIPILDGDHKGTTVTVRSSQITSTRQIHNILRALKVDDSDRINIKKCLKKITFSQKLLDPRSTDDLIRVFRMAKSGDYFDDDVPMSTLDESIFSRDCVGSAFAAFGATAPSFYDPQGTPLQILKRSEANKLAFGGSTDVSKRRKGDGKSTVLPQGLIPVYIKSSQQAVDDFKTMLKLHCMAVRMSPRGGVQGVSYNITIQKVASIEAMLSDCFAPKKSEKKRNRDIADEFSKIDLEEAAKRATKRAKVESQLGAKWDEVEN